MARPVSRSWGSETSCETGVIAMTDKPISPLRQRMIEDMTARHFAEKAQTDYIRYVKNFAAFLGRSPDAATAEEPSSVSTAHDEDPCEPGGHQRRSSRCGSFS